MFRPCGSNKVKIEEAQLKNQLAQTDNAVNADQKLPKNHGNLMLPDRVIATQNPKMC